MAEGTITDTQMVDVTLHPDGFINGAPQWEVVGGNATLQAPPNDPSGLTMRLVSETLPAGVDQAETEFLVSAKVSMSGEEAIEETIILRVVRPGATTLGATFGQPVPKA